MQAAAALPTAAVTGRVHPLERAAAAAVQRSVASQWMLLLMPLLRGVLDMPLQQPPWQEAYKSLQLPRLDRLTRFFGRRLLHAWCTAVQCDGCALVQGGHGAGVASGGVLLSPGLRWG
jgi:hypothetical protein